MLLKLDDFDLDDLGTLRHPARLRYPEILTNMINLSQDSFLAASLRLR